MEQVKGRLRVPVHSQFLVLRHDHGPPGGQSQDRRHSQSGRRLERLGLTWDKGADIRLDILPDNGGASYLSGVELLTPTRGPGKALSYPWSRGHTGRSAVLLAGARVILYCSGDGTADAKTPEGSRDELVSIGAGTTRRPTCGHWVWTAAAPASAILGTASVSTAPAGWPGICAYGQDRGGQEPPDKEDKPMSSTP